MRTKFWAAMSLALISFTACEHEQIPGGDQNEEFRVNSMICQSELVTRAPQMDQNGSGSFSNGDKNTFLFVNDSRQVIKDFEYTYGQSYRWSDIGLPQEVKKAQLTAWYPAGSTPTPTDFSWNVQTEANPDFLMAAPVSIKARQAEPIQLNFKHMMHKLQVKLVSDDPAISQKDLSAAKIVCRNFYPIVSLNLIEATSGAVSGNLYSLSKTDSKADFILPAQAVGTIEVEVTMNDKKNVFRISEMTVGGVPVSKLESGKTLTLTVTATQTELTLSAGISGWENQGDCSDTIII